MLRPGLITLGLVAVLAFLGWWLLGDWVRFGLLVWRVTPAEAFTEARVPPPPDYFDEAGAWAALPWRADLADVSAPPAYVDGQATAPVDVFFVHPTTYYRSDNWNQPIDDAATNALTALNVLRGQASVFNGCCRVFAPRYRQATLYAFMDRSGSGAQALAVAYADVLRAFEHYLATWNNGRPFVLAGHSQGAQHLHRLLRERIAGSTEAPLLIAAYAVGTPIESGTQAAPAFAPCEHATATGCYVSWNSIGPAAYRLPTDHDIVCVNPLSWRGDSTPVPAAANPGSLQWPFVLRPEPATKAAAPPLEPGIAGARCDDGLLLVDAIASDRFSARPLGRDNYHIYDYGLFWESIRRNVAARVDAYTATP